MELRDQRVLVTGTTAGIGRETAELFARRGATVIITGRDIERGAQTVAAIEAEGGRAEFVAADLNDIRSVRRLADQARTLDRGAQRARASTARPGSAGRIPHGPPWFNDRTDRRRAVCARARRAFMAGGSRTGGGNARA